VVIPGMGDDIQAIKAGIFEVGDVFLINKADREGSDKTVSDLRLMMDMDHKKHDEGGWRPPILKAQAVFDEGVKELLEEIDNHGKYLVETCGGLNFWKRRDKVREELTEMVKVRLVEDVLNMLMESGELDRAVEFVIEGKLDPYTACDNLLFSRRGR